MTTEADLQELGSQAFRSARVLHRVYIAVAVAFGVVILILTTLGQDGMAGLEREVGLILTGALALVTIVDSFIEPLIARQILNAREPTDGALDPDPIDQLVRASQLSSGFAFSTAIYGVVLAGVWDGLFGLAFVLVALGALTLRRPEWHMWNAHIEKHASKTRRVRPSNPASASRD